MNSLAAMIERNAALYPHQLAVSCEDRTLTNEELLNRGIKLGCVLHQLGARHRDRVSMLSMNNPEYFEFYAACQLWGFISATVNFRLQAPEIETILVDSSPRVVIFEEQYLPVMENIRHRLSGDISYICIGGATDWAADYEQLIASTYSAPPTYRPTADDPASLIYTSGTTGKPKGVIKTHSAELARARLFTMLDVRPGGRMLLIMPMFHCGSGSMFLAQQWSTGSVYLHRHFDPIQILKTIEEERITITHMAPTMVQAVLDVANIRDYDLSSLETLCYTAAPMPVPLLKKGLELLGPIFVNSWGMTETNGTVMLKHQHLPHGTAKDIDRLASVGQALPETELCIVDDEDREVPTGKPGELVVKSPTSLAYYWNNSIATAAALRNGWFHTGDIASMDDEGFIFLLDRKADMIISGGENIYCQEVEQALFQHTLVEDVAVIGVPDDYWGEAVHATVVLKPGSTLSADELIDFCSSKIARYKRPKYVVFSEQLPRLPSGKVNKVALKKKYRQ